MFDMIQHVLHSSQEQLIQISKLPKAIDIAEREPPELVVDWVNVSLLYKFQQNSQISSVIK